MSKVLEFFVKKFKEELLDREITSLPSYNRPRPYRNGTVKFRPCAFSDFDKRIEILKETDLNAFFFPAHQIPGCDLLSDSGSTTMTMEQWGQLLLGDESYGSNEGYFELKNQIVDTFGEEWRQTDKNQESLFIFHQGRAAEHALFSYLKKIRQTDHPLTPDNLAAGLIDSLKERIQKKIKRWHGESQPPMLIIPSNSHFDTTEANIEFNQIIALNIPCREHETNNREFEFRGNMNVEYLESLLEHQGDRVPLVYLTVTNNTGGGQPVSMANIKAVRKITRRYNVPFFLDACRFAENAWFIQQREKGYARKSITGIVKEMFEQVDGFHISFKKDGLVNVGGGLVIKPDSLFIRTYPDIAEKLTDHQILTEGNPTYGGLAGRDLKGLVEGLKTVVSPEYLGHRIKQVGRFGTRLRELGIPIIEPPGGHAVYINMDEFFKDTDTRDADFKGVSFTALMLVAGHRLCELGIYAFGKYREGTEIPPDPRVNHVRAAIPRLAYEDQDLSSVAEAIRILYEHRDRIPGVTVEYGRDKTLRHFKSRFKFKD